jgi:nitrogen fixation/metabolism regulation signal transduction histidine kinase
MTKKTITPAAALVGAALVGSLGAFGLAQAAGNPIPPETLARVGTPFFSTKHSGTGVGLAYVQRVADAHGWTFELTSDAHTGTRARLWV